MADGLGCDPSDLPGYIPWATVPPIKEAIHIGIVVSPSRSVHISHVVGGQKRSRDELDSNDVEEPVSKRPALSTGLDDVNSQDIDMGATNICLSPPGNFCSSSPGRFHVIDLPSPGGWGPGDNYIWSPFSFPNESVHEYIKESICKETGGSYWYRVPLYNQPEPPSSTTFNEKLIQDMDLHPGRTFFHINDMVSAKKRNRGRCSRNDPMLELFARVVHTGCGVCLYQSFQCFKLEDLFGGQPHMSGIMMFSNKESPMYCESSPFLATTKTEDKCYCLCRLVEDGMSELGWSLYIYDIQPVTWEIIRSVHANLGKQVQGGLV